jgi:antitoxin CptB
MLPLKNFQRRAAMSEKHNFQRVRWHSRRGMLELDLWLVPFADKHFLALSAADQDAYVQLLEAEDQDLLAWRLGHSVPENPDLARILQIIKNSQ